MGCWLGTDLITRMPIQEGDDVVCFPTTSYSCAGRGPESSKAKTLPIFGKYDEYGKLYAIVDDVGFRLAEKQYGEKSMDIWRPDELPMVHVETWNEFSGLTNYDVDSFSASMAVENLGNFVTKYLLLSQKESSLEQVMGLTNDEALKKLGLFVRERTEEEKEILEGCNPGIVAPDLFSPHYSFLPELLKFPENDYANIFARFIKFQEAVHSLRRSFTFELVAHQGFYLDDHLKVAKLIEKMYDKFNSGPNGKILGARFDE